MNKLIHFGRVLVAVFAGFMLMLATACSNPNMISRADSGHDPNTGSYYQHEGSPTDLYSPLQERKGGMNNYEDTDFRTNTKGAKDTAKGLIENAQNNINKVNSPQDYGQRYRQGTPLNQRVENLGRDMSGSADQLKEDVSKGVERGIRNTRANVEKVPSSVSNVVEEATQGAKERAKDAAKTTQRTADVVTDNFGEVGDKLKNRSQEAVNSAQRSLNTNTDKLENRF